MPRAQREQLILDAATTEFGRFGYAGAALSAVAAQAGVSKPLVMGYFGSNDGLYIACVQRAAEDTLTAVFHALAPRPHDWNVINDRTPRAGGTAQEAARRVRTTISVEDRGAHE